MCNEAALFAARGAKAAVTMTDFENAVDRIIGGLEKKNKVISKVERRTVALHEAGHAVVGWFLQYAEPLLKARASASRAHPACAPDIIQSKPGRCGDSTCTHC